MKKTLVLIMFSLICMHSPLPPVEEVNLSLPELSEKYSEVFKLAGPLHENEKKVALTFDDGPDHIYTEKILDILNTYNLKATFFLIGKLVEKHPHIVERIHAEGHIIGNHTYNHPFLPKASLQTFITEIAHTNELLYPIIGYEPKLLRPPYGEINEEQLIWIASQDYLAVNWNVDSLDWKSISSEEIINNVVDSVRPGSIILQHSGGSGAQNLMGTVKALPLIIQQLQDEGYEFVTVPELLETEKENGKTQDQTVDG